MFKVDSLDAARDDSRIVGHVPPRTRLIAGLDPAATGYQAAFLWAYDVENGKLYMVDIENKKGDMVNRLGLNNDPIHINDIEPALIDWYKKKSI